MGLDSESQEQLELESQVGIARTKTPPTQEADLTEDVTHSGNTEDNMEELLPLPAVGAYDPSRDPLLGKWVRCAHLGDTYRNGQVMAVGRLGSVPPGTDPFSFPDIRYQVEFADGHTRRLTEEEFGDALNNYYVFRESRGIPIMPANDSPVVDMTGMPGWGPPQPDHASDEEWWDELW